MKLHTRSIDTRSDIWQVEVARAIIEAYVTAARSMPFAYLVSIERQIEHSDVSFVLTFEPMRMRQYSTDDTVVIEWLRPETHA